MGGTSFLVCNFLFQCFIIPIIEVFPWLHLFLVLYLFIFAFVANEIDLLVSFSVYLLSVCRKPTGVCVLILHSFTLLNW